jgi:iron(III) transport system permease protein
MSLTSSLKTDNFSPGAGYRSLYLRLAGLIFILITYLPFFVPLISGNEVSAASLAISQSNFSLLWFSLKISFCSAFFALLVGLPLGICLWDRSYWTLKIKPLLIFFLLLPPYMYNQGWAALTSNPPPGMSFLSAPSGEIWLIFLLSTAFAPLCALIVSAAPLLLPTDTIESAYLVFSPDKVLGKIIFPMLKNLILALLLITIVLILLDGTMGLSLQIPLYSTEITARFFSGETVTNLIFGTWPLLLVSAILSFAAIYLGNNYSLGNSKSLTKISNCFKINKLSKPLRQFLHISSIATLVICLLPVTGLVRQSLFNASSGLSLATDGNAVLWSFFVAVITAAISTIITVPLGASFAGNYSSKIFPLFFIPLLIPASMSGIAWTASTARLSQSLTFLPESTAIIASHLARALPFAFIISVLAWKTSSQKSVRESTYFLTGHIGLKLRLELPFILLNFVIAALISLRELEASVLTIPPGGQTLPLRVFNLMHYGAGADVCRLSLGLAFVIALATIIVIKRWPE